MSTDYKFFNRNILYFISIFFITLVISRMYYAYSNVKEYEVDYAKREAKSLKTYAIAHRVYYQKLYINKVIKLNSKTLAGLPAYSSNPISEIFSQNNSFNIKVKTVSDRARNPENHADTLELKAINYFKKNKNKDEYFDDTNKDTYQYGYALRIEKKCLKCHGAKEDAPKFIQDKYSKAYDYKLNELRGIISIKLPKDKLNNFFSRLFYHSVIYDGFLLILLFSFLFYLLKKFKYINIMLEDEINKKTLQIHKSKENLENLLITDNLTKLFNRRKLIVDIDNSSSSKSIHLALLNIDRFKDINDFYGHDVADVILKEVANLLRGMCEKSTNVIYKLPSDEYAIYTTNEMTETEFKKQISLVIDIISKTKFEIDEYKVYITFSCGIASNISPIMLKADMALQKAKVYRENIIIYDDSLSVEDTIKSNIKGLALLNHAIKKDQIVPYFQPIYNLENSTIEKYECLARIVKEDGEVIAPFLFLDVAMKSKLYPEITKNIVEKSFKYFENRNYEFSINISFEDIINTDTVAFLFNALKNYKNPNRVTFEILETDKIENYAILKNFIDDIKVFGCKIAIDDFGSGYSNFSHIMELKVDYLKIDASLVKNILTDVNSKKVTQTIINFAKDLGMKTIAEFVEDKKSLELLKEMNSDYAQGYYIGKPSKDIQA